MHIKYARLVRIERAHTHTHTLKQQTLYPSFRVYEQSLERARVSVFVYKTNFKLLPQSNSNGICSLTFFGRCINIFNWFLWKGWEKNEKKKHKKNVNHNNHWPNLFAPFTWIMVGCSHWMSVWTGNSLPKLDWTIGWQLSLWNFRRTTENAKFKSHFRQQFWANRKLVSIV